MVPKLRETSGNGVPPEIRQVVPFDAVEVTEVAPRVLDGEGLPSRPVAGTHPIPGGSAAGLVARRETSFPTRVNKAGTPPRPEVGLDGPLGLPLHATLLATVVAVVDAKVAGRPTGSPFAAPTLVANGLLALGAPGVLAVDVGLTPTATGTLARRQVTNGGATGLGPGLVDTRPRALGLVRPVPTLEGAGLDETRTVGPGVAVVGLVGTRPHVANTPGTDAVLLDETTLGVRVATLLGLARQGVPLGTDVVLGTTVGARDAVAEKAVVKGRPATDTVAPVAPLDARQGAASAVLPTTPVFDTGLRPMATPWSASRPDATVAILARTLAAVLREAMALEGPDTSLLGVADSDCVTLKVSPPRGGAIGESFSPPPETRGRARNT